VNDDLFQYYSAYYDLLYRDKDYAAEAAYLAEILRASGEKTHEVLEFGCGTGRHGRLLAEHGFQVFGVERSESMVEAARYPDTKISPKTHGEFDCMLGDIRSVEVGRVFDAVLSLFHVISYQTCNVDLLQTFANAARHLRPRGIFVFDVWHGPAVLSQHPVVRVKRVEDNATRITRIAEPELDTTASVVTVAYTILADSKLTSQLTTIKEEHRMRYLFPSEVDLLGAQTGFEVERSEEFFTGQKPSGNTWGVLYILRKRT